MEAHIDNPVHSINLEEPLADAQLGYHRRFTAEVAGRNEPIAGNIAFNFRGDRYQRRFYAEAHLDSEEFSGLALPLAEGDGPELPRETISDDGRAEFFVETVVAHALHGAVSL